MNTPRRITLRICLAACAALLLGSCAAPLLPSPKLPREKRTVLSDETVLQSLREDWARLQQVQMSDEERGALVAEYNARLLTLLRRVRYDVFRTRSVRERMQTLGLFELVHEGAPDTRALDTIYNDIVPAADVPTDSLDERYGIPGLGVPLVGVIPVGKIHPGDQVAHFKARGTVSTLTAVLEFPKHAAKPVLRLIPRHSSERVQVGRLSYPLAGDFSAAIEIYWNLTNIKRGRFLGLLNPQKLRDTTGLSSMERYHPDKTPVVLAHGLASSAETFHNLVNRLLSDPDIRLQYQFWYFNYPTGIAWTHTAADYRKALQMARARFDPHGKNHHWDNMVLVGHSMGGLITHYSQSREPWKILNAAPRVREQFAPYLQKKYVNTAMPDPALEKMRPIYFFEPVRAGQVIYMATPHRGAPIAQNRFITFLTRLVELPQTLVQEVFSIATLQEDNALANPRRLTEWFTSVGQLSPHSYAIRGLAPLAVQDVPTLSIIGDRGRGDTPRSSDGIVPYWSSHIPWGSESIVPADHSVQDIPETADILKNLLKKRLSHKR